MLKPHTKANFLQQKKHMKNYFIIIDLTNYGQFKV